MATWYKLSVYDCKFREIEVIKETESYVTHEEEGWGYRAGTVTLRRERKEGWFRTKEEAVADAIMGARQTVGQYEKMAEHAKERLFKLLDLNSSLATESKTNV